MVLLTAEVMELKANPNRVARGLVIEAELDKGKGYCCNSTGTKRYTACGRCDCGRICTWKGKSHDG